MGAKIIDARMMREREKVKDAASRQRQRRRQQQQQQQNRTSATASQYPTDIHNGSLDSNTDDDNLSCECAQKQPLQMFLNELLNDRPLSRTNRSLITPTIEEEDVGSSRSESSSSSSSSSSSGKNSSGQPDEEKSTFASPMSWKLVSDTARIPHRGLQSRQFMPSLTSSSLSSFTSVAVARGYDGKVEDRWSPSISPSKSVKNDDRSSSASMPAIPYRRSDHEFDRELDVGLESESEHEYEYESDRSSLINDIAASMKNWNIIESESELEAAAAAPAAAATVVEATGSSTSKQQMSRQKQKLQQHQQQQQQQQQDEDEAAVSHRIVPIRSYSFDHILTFPVVGVLNDHHPYHYHLEQEEQKPIVRFGGDMDDILDMRLTTCPKTLDAASTKSVQVFRSSSKTTTTGTNKSYLVKTSNNIDTNNNNKNNNNTTRISNRSRELLERSVLIASKSM